MLDLLAQPESSIPYVQIGLIIILYKSTLLSSDGGFVSDDPI
jgi:hypothetical protein